MLNELKEAMNLTTTENGAITHESSTNHLVDLFGSGGAYRNRSEEDIVILFSKAYAEDKVLALKTLFYLRDIRGGQGERRFFRVATRYLANAYPEDLKQVLEFIPEYGRWDDLIELIDTPVKESVGGIIKDRLQKDTKIGFLRNLQRIDNIEGSINVSLLAKWLPSTSTRSAKRKIQLKEILKALGLNHSQYRKILSSLRKELDLVETKITNNNFTAIKYDKIPSVAGLKYRNLFYRKDEHGYLSFLEDVSNGEKTINAGTLFASDLVSKAMRSWGMSHSERQYLNGAWDNLPDYIGDRKEMSIPVIDVSGSMSGLPMEVAIALGLYVSERNYSAYNGHFITFSERPEMVKIVGNDFVDKVTNIKSSSWGYNTNLTKVFDLVLDVAIKNNISQEDMVDKIYIISDMEFDSACRGNNKTIFESAKDKFAEHDYVLPEIVFWNVDARNNNFPVKSNELGVKLVSGFSQSLFKDLVGDTTTTPFELMLQVINSERYDLIDLK